MSSSILPHNRNTYLKRAWGKFYILKRSTKKKSDLIECSARKWLDEELMLHLIYLFSPVEAISHGIRKFLEVVFSGGDDGDETVKTRKKYYDD